MVHVYIAIKSKERSIFTLIIYCVSGCCELAFNITSCRLSVTCGEQGKACSDAIGR